MGCGVGDPPNANKVKKKKNSNKTSTNSLMKFFFADKIVNIIFFFENQI